MRIDEKIGAEYETEGVSHSRAGRLTTRPAAHFQGSRIVRCPECLVSFLDFDAGQLLLLGLFGYSPFPIPHSPFPHSPIPHATSSM